MTRTAPLLLLAAALALCAVRPPAAEAATLAEIVDTASYRINTTYEKPDGASVTRTTTALAGVPSLVNADGAGLPDVIVELVPFVNLAALDVTRLPTLPANAKLSVEVVIDLPGTGGRKLAFGYDGSKSGAPGHFRALANFALGTTKTIDLDVTVDRPQQDLALTGELFTEGAGGARLEPQRGRIDYTPVPRQSGLRVEITPEDQRTSVELRASASAPVLAEATALNVEGNKQQELGATITGMPPTLDLALGLPEKTAPPDTPLSVVYDAPRRVDSIVVDGSEREDGALLKDLHAEVEGMAPHVEILREGPERMRVDASEPLGVVTVASASNGATAGLPAEDPVTGIPTVAGFERFLLATDQDDPTRVDDGVDLLQARVTGLSHVAFDGGSGSRRPLSVDARMAPGALFVSTRRDVVTPDESLSARLTDLPGEVHLTARLPDKPDPDPDAPATERRPEITELAFTGSGTIGRIELNAFKQGGLLASEPTSTTLRAVVEDLPSGSKVTAIKDGSPAPGIEQVIGFDANGPAPDEDAVPVGLVEVELSDGSLPPAGENLAPGHDGVIVRDRPERFRLFARVHGLRAVSLDKTLTRTTLALDAVGRRSDDGTFERRAFDVDVVRPESAESCEPLFTPGDEAFLDVTILRLQPRTKLELQTFGECNGRSFHYEAAGKVDVIELSTDAGSRVLLDARLEQVPDRLDLCLADDGRCTGGGRIADSSIELDASDEFRMPRLVDCVAVREPPGDRTREDVCREVPVVQANAQEIEFIDEATIATLDHATYLGFELRKQDGPEEGHLFLDTADERDTDPRFNQGSRLGGRIWRDSVDGAVIRAIIDPEFRADHRLAIIDGAGFAIERTTGLIDCGETTDLEANVKGLPPFDATGRPCKDD